LKTRILLWNSGFSAPRLATATLAAGRRAAAEWRARRFRRVLGDLDDYLLRDLGIELDGQSGRARLQGYAVEARGRCEAPVFLGR
jgi:uncharacterized protein YjiS (DUF1127 family)